MKYAKFILLVITTYFTCSYVSILDIQAAYIACAIGWLFILSLLVGSVWGFLYLWSEANLASMKRRELLAQRK